MPTPQNTGQANPWLVTRLLWGALLVSPFVYLFVLQRVPAPTQPPEPMMPPMLGAVALSIAAVSLWLPRMGFANAVKAALKSDRFTSHLVQDPDASMILREEAPSVRMLVNDKMNRDAVAALFFTPFVLSMALAESISTFGLVLGLLGFGWPQFLPFFCVTWLLFALRFPRPEAVMAQFEKVGGVQFEKPCSSRSRRWRRRTP